MNILKYTWIYLNIKEPLMLWLLAHWSAREVWQPHFDIKLQIMFSQATGSVSVETCLWLLLVGFHIWWVVTQIDHGSWDSVTIANKEGCLWEHHYFTFTVKTPSPNFSAYYSADNCSRPMTILNIKAIFAVMNTTWPLCQLS